MPLPQHQHQRNTNTSTITITITITNINIHININITMSATSSSSSTSTSASASSASTIYTMLEQYKKTCTAEMAPPGDALVQFATMFRLQDFVETVSSYMKVQTAAFAAGDKTFAQYMKDISKNRDQKETLKTHFLKAMLTEYKQKCINDSLVQFATIFSLNRNQTLSFYDRVRGEAERSGDFARADRMKKIRDSSKEKALLKDFFSKKVP
jgi:hypothetical protein